MDDEDSTETGVTDKSAPDVRMKDKGVTETPITYTGSSFVSLFFIPSLWKGHSHFKFINALT
jgi:hypothetical protein